MHILEFFLLTMKMLGNFPTPLCCGKELSLHATNFDFLNPISLQTNVADLRYLKLCIYFGSNNLNLKYLRFTDLQVANTEGLKHLSSWQSLNSFTSSLKNVNKKCSGTKERRCRFTFVTSYWFLNKGIESLPQT